MLAPKPQRGTKPLGLIPDQIQSSGRSESTRYYRPELDCLRFIAFFYVFVRHVWHEIEFGTADLSIPPILVGILQPIIAAGLYGVDVFFALSAFLITKLLLLERDRTGAVHVRSFYLRRILRIWPLYFAFVLLLMPYEVLAVGVRLKYYASLFTFTQNWYCSWNTVVESTLTLALWSVCVEEQFYLVWPFLIGCSKRLRNIGLLLCCVFAFTCLYRGITFRAQFRTPAPCGATLSLALTPSRSAACWPCFFTSATSYAHASFDTPQ